MSEPFFAKSVRDVQEYVCSNEQVVIVGGQSKVSPTSNQIISAVSHLNLAELTGIIEYDPSEFTITAKAGTRLSELADVLAKHGQYMPFDPPLVDRGATLGGCTAAGISGPSRLRYGGLRDFVLGVRLVDGAGNFISAGGKVVKNAAGFDIPKLMVGSWGSLGVLTEVTLKVFPRPLEHRTVMIPTASIQDAVDLIHRLGRTAIELDALDIDESNRILARVGGSATVSRASAERVLKILERNGEIVEYGEVEHRFWQPLLDWSWHRETSDLIRLPITGPQIVELTAAIQNFDTRRRFSVAGNVAWIDLAASSEREKLHSQLTAMRLGGRVLRSSNNTLSGIGFVTGNLFADRISAVFDPGKKFKVCVG